MSSIKTRKTKSRYVYTLFSKLDVEYNFQPKMCCKFCKWTVTKNATRMASHIMKCKSCPVETKENVYMIQTKDIKHPHLYNKGDKDETELVRSDDEELTRISANTSSISSNVTEDFIVQEELVEFESPDINHTERHNYTKPSRNIKSESDNNKYKFTIISSNNETNSKTDSTHKLNESSCLKESKYNEYKKESRAFGNWVTSEIDQIYDLEILNQMKHDISKILYNSKNEYLKKLKQSGQGC